MGKRNQTSFEIFSLFGQIEQVAGEMAIERGLATRIDQEDIPPSAAYSDDGNRRAAFAVIVPRANIPAFEKLIRELAA